MRSVSSSINNALVAAPDNGLVVREMVTIFAQDRDTGDIVPFAFWNDFGAVTANVLDGDTGAVVSRNFVGDGALLVVNNVPNVNDLSIQRVTVTFSQLHATVQDMVRGYNVRLARAEIHRPLFDPQTHNLVDTPPCHFLGQVSLSPVSTPAAGGEGGIDIDIVSDTQELTRVNPSRRSDATQQRRAPGDRMMRYASILAAGIDLPWGEERA
ncbi:hypothetical protein [Devosia sp. DBB001]|jgi:hypothetical protein|nr:hypothetical protein [Devosia sp. DBB001]